MINDLLLQWDQELDVDRQKAKKVMREKEEGEKLLWEEIQKLENATYVFYEQGFDKILAQLKYFSSGH